MTFLIARPKVKALQTLSAFTQQGLKSKIYPIVEIEFNDADNNIIQLNQAKPCTIIVTSTYVSQWLLTQIYHHKLTLDLKNINIVCVGRGSAKAIQDAGFSNNIFIASPENSEGLLVLPCLQNISQQSIVLLKGEGGRTLISDTLLQRQAKLTVIMVYKRVKNTQAINALAFEQSEIKCIIATSVEITEFLLAALDKKWLQTLHWIVASERIKDYAYSKGIKHLTVSQGADDLALLTSAKHLLNIGTLND